jgi:hypothetical protein
MSKQIFFIVALFFSMQMFAQTGIGTTTPNASAKLDVYSTNKGFLPPRVILTSTTDATTIASPAEGLLVYNLGSTGLQAGYYYWNATSWATIATASSAGNGVTSSDLVKLYGEAWSNATGKIGNTNGYTFTVPVSGRYLFDFSSTTYGSTSFTINFYVRQGATNIGSDGQVSTNNGVRVEYNGKVEVNLQSGVTYNVYVTSTNPNRGTEDYDRVYYKQVAGNLPVTGQTVDYVQASLSTNQSLSAAANIIFNVSSGAGITITSGGFNLIANKTYKLEAALGGTSGGYAYYGWVDNTNTLLSGGSIGAVIKAGEAYTDAPQDKAIVYYTPTIDTRVFLRVYNLSGTLTAYAPSMSRNYSSSWANITQIGSSAFISPWTLSGTDTYNTSGNVGIGTSTPSASALLDLTSTSKGLLPPRVALTTKSGTTTIASPTTGLIVYNTASAGTGGDAVTPGYYFFNGIIWTRMDPEGWSTAVAITFGAPSSTTSPTKGASPTYDYVRYRNLGGKEYEVEYNFVQVNTGTAGNSDYLITLPGGLKFDFTASGQTAYTGATGINAISARLVSAFGDLFHVSAHNSATAVPYDATRFRIHTNSWGSVGWTFYNYTYYQLSVEKSGFKMTFKFKAT